MIYDSKRQAQAEADRLNKLLPTGSLKQYVVEWSDEYSGYEILIRYNDVKVTAKRNKKGLLLAAFLIFGTYKF